MTSPAPRGSTRAVILAAVGGLALGAIVFVAARGSSPDAPDTSGAPILPSALPTGAPTTQPGASLPPEAVAEQGKRYFAVFVAVAAEAGDPELLTAQRRAHALGYSGGIGDLNCTAGAREQLKLPADRPYTAYSVFFGSQDRADRFVAAYGARVAGTALITAGCLD